MVDVKNNMSLATKLAKIGKEIGLVKKSGRNDQRRYNFIEYAVVAGKIRELLDEYKVAIVPSVDNYDVDTITSSKGVKGYHYTLAMSFKIINGDDPKDQFEATWLGEGADYGDKGINKAETSGTKYFLMRLFNVSEKGEEEADKTTPTIEQSVKKLSLRDISMAVSRLEQATSEEMLRNVYRSLDYAVMTHPEVVKKKDEMKAKLAEEKSDETD